MPRPRPPSSPTDAATARQAAPREKEKIRVILPSPCSPRLAGGAGRRALRRLPRSRPRARRKNAATPTIWRARRSSACANGDDVSARARDGPRSRGARRQRSTRAFPTRPRAPETPRIAACAARFGRCRRRSWFRHAAPARPLIRRRRHRRPPYADGAGMTTRAVRRRRPKFRSRGRSICAPRRRSRRVRERTTAWPRTCCRRRNRCSTRSCRNNNPSVCDGSFGKASIKSLAADAREAASRGFVPGADRERAAVGGCALALSPRRS